MSDIVKKYQHYFNESVKLQELVNEQAAYIKELEEALAALSEDYVTPERAEELDQASKTADEKYKARATELLKPKKKKGKTAVNLSPEEQQELHDLRTAAELASIHKYLETTHKTKLYGKGGNLIGKVSPPEN